MNRVRDLEFAERQVYLHPGEVFFAHGPAVVTTILGPCVSVCLYNQRRGIAGMNHYLVPMKLAGDSARSAEFANELLLSKFVQAGIAAESLQAKVFGGATMRAVNSDLAQRNVAAAFTFLERAGVEVVASDVGGDRGRKLHFRTEDGTAWVRLL